MKRRGFILGLIVMGALVLAVFLFGYNTVVRRQNIRAHHEQIGEVASMLALTGANLLADQMSALNEDLLQNLAPSLLTSPDVSDLTAPDPTGLLAKARSDFQAYLQEITDLNPRPVCRKMELFFDNISQISPDTDAIQMQKGRDPVEKFGFVNLSCTVEYQGLSRKAMVRRQFRVISMIPGSCCRFTLFVPFTPSQNSYNGLGVVYNGDIDGGYTHPFPSSGLNLRGALKIQNGTDTLVAGSPNTPLDLGGRGWIFLGPSHDSTLPGPVILRIPSGYDTAAGGHFMISKAALNPAGKRVVPPENIADPSAYSLSGSSGNPCFIHGIFQGFFTAELDSGGAVVSAPVAAKGLWNLPNPGESASTWLFPFGDEAEPSRTLVVGPVLAGFLKYYLLKTSLPPVDPAYWSVCIKPRASSNPNPALVYDKTRQINTPDAVPAAVPKYEDIFLAAGGESGPVEGLLNLTRVSPACFLPGPSSAGTAFNVLFDFMGYLSPYPNFLNGSSVLSAVGSPLLVPKGPSLSTTSPPGIHPWEPDFTIRFRDGSNPDDLYFQGNLENYCISDSFLSRVSHVLDLSSCTSVSEENSLLAASIFHLTTAAEDPAHADWYKFQRKGIFFIMRRKPVSGPLTLPGLAHQGIFLDRNAVLAVDDGDVLIPNQVKADLVNGAPGKLFSIIALKGSIILNTERDIHAYLIALKKGPSGGRGGGKLICGSGNTAKKMNVFGGVAVWEMGMYPDDGSTPTTMTTFLNGGLIRYNPRFNPGSSVYDTSREFMLEDKPSSVEITGDGL